jgi:Excalibur calcium-binding domain
VEPDAKPHQRISWTRGDPRLQSSQRAQALARTFLLLESQLDSLTTRASRYQRPRRRYEDLCIATAVRRVQRDWLVSTTDSGWTAPAAKASLLFATKLELVRQTLELARSRRWLSGDARREAEARARKRFEMIATELAAVVPAELLRVEEMSPPEPAPGNHGESPYATYRRLRAIMAAATQAVPPRAARELAARMKRLRGGLWVPSALRRERKPLARPRSELPGEHARTRRAAAVGAAAVFVALAMVIGLTGSPSENLGSEKGGPNHRGSAAAERKVGAVKATAGPPAPAFEAVMAGDGRQAHAYHAEGPGSGGVTEGLVVALAAWTTPAVAREKDCSDFTNQKRAQRWFNQHHPHRDPAGLDRDHDGKACERNPCPCSPRGPRRDRRGPAPGARADEQASSDVVAPTGPSGSTPTGTTGTMLVAAPPPPALVPASALTPSPPITQAVRNVDQAAATAGVQTGLSQATGGLTGGLDGAVGGAGDTLDAATGGLLGN